MFADSRGTGPQQATQIRRYAMLRSMTVALVLCAALVGTPTATSAGSGVNSVCNSGGTPAQLTSVESLPDGGEIHHYNVDGNSMVPVPPIDFDPVYATAEQLDTYGFPPRPSTAAALDQWQGDMNGWKRTPIDISSPICLCPLDTPWSGYVVHKATDTYIAVQGDFHQPYFRSSSCLDPQEGSWTGIGGYETLAR